MFEIVVGCAKVIGLRGLQLLSAIAICRYYRNSERRVGPSFYVSWNRNCFEICPIVQGLPEDDETSLIMVEELSWSDKWECSRVVVCGWCMFSRWIKNQTIPSQLKKYTKAVLNYMVTHKTYFPEYESVQ